MPKIGDKFGRWTVLSVNTSGLKYHSADCMCECGTSRTVIIVSLKSGRSTSCGCRQREMSKSRKTKHGSSHTREYRIWENMKARCLKKASPVHKYYGERGIVVCERWMSFENFISDMGLSPSQLHTLERVSNDGNYEPSNCRWATRKEQSNNTRRNRRIAIGGVTRTMSEWSDVTGTKQDAIHKRLSRGWTNEEAVFGKVSTSVDVKGDGTPVWNKD